MKTFTDRRPATQQGTYDSGEAWRQQNFLESLADRTRPLPPDVSAEQLLKIASQKLIEIYDERWRLQP